MRNDLKKIEKYIPPHDSFVNLANNENYYLNWEEIVDINKILKNSKINQYGNSKHELLKKNYAKYANIDSKQILVGPGSDTLISLLINALTNTKILTLKQDFFRYNEISLILKRENTQLLITSDLYENIINTTNLNNIEMIILSNPNNPLGIMHKKEEIIKILENTNAYVIIDEAYFEFASESVVELITKYDKLIVLRTLSKAFGLAGLRVGFALLNQELIEYVQIIKGPFVLSDLNALIANEVLNNLDLIKESIVKIKNEKKEFELFLQNNQISFKKSYANFIYVEINDAKKVQLYLNNLQIAVAYFAPNGLRITIGTKVQMDQLKKALILYFNSQKN